LLCLLVIRVLNISLPMHRNARRIYLIGGMSLYAAMLSIYWSVQYIPSGLVSVIFGLAPIITSIIASWWLDEGKLTFTKLAGIFLGICGLALVFRSGLQFSEHSIYGIVGVLFAVCIHSVSSVWMKKVGQGMSSAAITTGELIVAVPLYVLTWWIFDGNVPDNIPVRTSLAILYLGSVGSVLGFILYFYVLKHVQVATVTLIMLVTPVLALLLGSLVDHEPVQLLVWVGAGLILTGLLIHQVPVAVVFANLLKNKANSS